MNKFSVMEIHNVKVIKEITFALGFVNLATTSKETAHDD